MNSVDSTILFVTKINTVGVLQNAMYRAYITWLYRCIEQLRDIAVEISSHAGFQQKNANGLIVFKC